jgi:hypothetical protein
MADLIAELAEVVRLQRLVDATYGCECENAMEDRDNAAVNFLRTHHAEIEAMARKARRYDWLNAHRLDFIARNNMHEPRVYLPVGTELFQPDAMDNTIDKAMRDSAREDGDE